MSNIQYVYFTGEDVNVLESKRFIYSLIHLEPNWSENFVFFLTGKTLEAKQDSLAIFRDSKMVDATLWSSRCFKAR